MDMVATAVTVATALQAATAATAATEATAAMAAMAATEPRAVTAVVTAENSDTSLSVSRTGLTSRAGPFYFLRTLIHRWISRPRVTASSIASRRISS